jgi:tol-pal system protein YbgF
MAGFHSGQYKAAAEIFSAFPSRYPRSSLVPNALYWLGECHYSQDRYDEAVLTVQAVTGQYPKHPKAAAALLKTAYSYERLGDKQNARFYLGVLLEDYPQSDPAPLAEDALNRLR